MARQGVLPGTPAATPGPLAELRLQMGLPPVPGNSLAAARSAGWHLEDLALLGRQLLGAGAANADAFATPTEGLGVEVLVSAARQRLMTMEPQEMSIGHLELLAADYASLAGHELQHRLLARCATCWGDTC